MKIVCIKEKHGFIFKPKGDGPFPGIVVLHGSLGGWGDFWYEPGWELPTGLENDTAKFARFCILFLSLLLCWGL